MDNQALGIPNVWGAGGAPVGELFVCESAELFVFPNTQGNFIVRDATLP